MDRIFEAIEEWMRNLLTGMVSSNLTTMYTDVNEKTGQIAAQVGQTPQGWNGNIFSMIQNLSDRLVRESEIPDEDLHLEFLNTLLPFHPDQRYHRDC